MVGGGIQSALTFHFVMIDSPIVLRFFTLFSVLNNFRNAIKFNLFIIFFH